MSEHPGWPLVSAKDIARISIGGTPSRNVPSFWAEGQSGMPWVSIADMDCPVIETTSETITETGARYSNVKLVPVGTTLMSFKLSLGRVAVAGRDLYTNEAIAAFHIDPQRVDRRWLLYQLPRSVKNVVADIAVKGATLNKKKLQGLQLVLPDLAVQRRIAEILATLDDAIRKTEQLIAKLQLAKQGLLHDLLTRGIDDLGEIRDDEASDRRVAQLSEACALIRDGTHLPPKRVDSGPLLFSVQNMFDGTLRPTSMDTRVSLDFYTQMHKTWEIRTGDVCLAIVGATLGKTAVVPPMEKFTLQRSVAVFRGRVGQLVNDYLYLWLSSPEIQTQLWASSNQTAQPGIYLATLAQLEISLPPYDEQLRIAEMARAAQLRIDVESDALRKLQLLKSGLMDDLLTGRVRVPLDTKVTA